MKKAVEGRNSSYVLFDDPDARTLFQNDIKKFQIQFIHEHGVSVLDEIQYCQEAGQKLKYLADTGNTVWITSSSEVILAKDVLSYLVGRVSIVHLYPFSFPEFLKAKNIKAAGPDMVRRAIWEHMTYGGYPKVVLTNELDVKKRIIFDLYQTMLYKDVSSSFNIEDISSLEKLVRYLAVLKAPILNYNKLCKNLDMSFVTMKKYLAAMEKSYFITMVEPFFSNKSKEITKQPKAYFIDTGMRNTVAKSFPSEPDGLLFENYVLTEMIKYGVKPKYWRTKSNAEVDFIIELGNEVIPVEVKLRAEPGRIERSMRAFISYYKPKKAFVVAYKGESGVDDIEKCRVVTTDVPGLLDQLKQMKLPEIPY